MEYTGGTTGVSLAFVCAAKGYKLRIVFSDAFSQEKALMMEALGAQISMVPSQGRGISEKLIKEMIRRAARYQPATTTLVVRPTEQPGRDSGLLPAGGGDLETD